MTSFFPDKGKPNVALWSLHSENPNTNIGQVTDCRVSGYSWLSSTPQAHVRILPYNRPQMIPPTALRHEIYICISVGTPRMERASNSKVMQVLYHSLAFCTIIRLC